MQWDSSVNAGFSSAPKDMLYIRQDEAPDRPTAKAQINDRDSLLNEIKKLIAIRQSVPSLQSNGKITFLYAEKNAYPFAYLRSNETEKILVILNPSHNEASFSCQYIPKEAIYMFGKAVSYENGIITMPGGSAGFYRI